MELHQGCSVSLNEYEGDEETENRDAVKMENIYQSLRHKPAASNRTVNNTTLVSDGYSGRKFVLLLVAVNILISAIILAIVGLNYFYNKETQLIHVANGQRAAEKEVWLLYDNVFYLFWNDHSDCRTAESLCSQRNASLAILTEQNMVWLHFMAKGKPYLVMRASVDGSGAIASFSDDDDHECGTMTSDGDLSEGFVCQSAISPIHRPEVYF